MNAARKQPRPHRAPVAAAPVGAGPVEAAPVGAGPVEAAPVGAGALDEALVQLVEPLCLAHGVELVDVRRVAARGGAVLRIIIDRSPAGSEVETDSSPAVGSGVSLDDCTAVSRDVSAALDVHDGLVAGSFRLEVSSPGLERPLVRPADFQRFRDREVRISTQTPVDGRRRHAGVLRGLDGDTVWLEVDGERKALPFGTITKANLVYRFQEPSRKKA